MANEKNTNIALKVKGQGQMSPTFNNFWCSLWGIFLPSYINLISNFRDFVIPSAHVRMGDYLRWQSMQFTINGHSHWWLKSNFIGYNLLWIAESLHPVPIQDHDLVSRFFCTAQPLDIRTVLQDHRSQQSASTALDAAKPCGLIRIKSESYLTYNKGLENPLKAVLCLVWLY